MITARAWTFLVAAGVLYLFANQTQVGWLYVMSALLMGVVLVSAWLSRGTLRRIKGTRRVGMSPDTDYFESDATTIEFTLHGHKLASQLRVMENCPLAAPDDPRHRIAMFIPSLPARSSVKFDYDVTLDRRGLHEFPPVKLETRAPFGFFRQQRDLVLPTRVLVYPEVRELAHLDLLDRQLAPQMPRPRAGVGYEVMGVRPYRTGDSPRDIHWRSVARTGQLIVKEYADEAQPGLTLVLDTFAHPYLATEGKHTPFEWAVKCAASIGDYAQVKGYPLHLQGDDTALPYPSGAVSRSVLLQYLARIQPIGKQGIGFRSPLQAFLAVILPWPDRSIIASLTELHHQRVEILAVVIDPATFPGIFSAGPSAAPLVDELRAVGITTRYIRFADDWANQLAEQDRFQGETR